jgi:acetyl esterase
MPLHPDCVAYLKTSAEWMAVEKLPPFWEMPAPQARRVCRDSILASKPPLAPMHTVEDRAAPTRGGPRPVRILRPRTDGALPLPLMLYIHSGGYVIGGIDESEQEARRFAARTPALVVSMSYRLAPEHRMPAAAEDAWDVLEWAAANAAALGADPARLIVGGCSAGGGLTAILSRLSAERGGPRIALAILLCPWLDLTMSQPSVTRFARGYDLDREFLDWFVGAYVGPAGDARHPLASPLLHSVAAEHPPAVILAAECDPLFDEARLYAERLRQAGVPVTAVEAPGMIHAFNEITHLIPAGAPLLEPLHAAVGRVLVHS